MIKNIFLHLGVVLHHKWKVFLLSIHAGIPIRGILHDLSKFTPSEFIPSVHYFAGGIKSPISLEKNEIGYSKVWLHHKGRNKHHPEYWYDADAPQPMPIIPFCYVCEMICDQLAAGMVYEGKHWTKEHQLEYWNKQRKTFQLNHLLKKMLDKVYTEVAKKGVKEVITKQNLANWYQEYTKNQVETTSQKN